MRDANELLATCVPLLLRRRLARDPTVPDPGSPPVAERLTVAAMFADISGYSRITEELAARGPGGVEQLSDLLNIFFGRLIERVRAFGGDVAKFAGDALVAVWPVGENDAGPATALARAAACALSVQQVLHDREIAHGQRLWLRVGLGVGEVIAVPVGGLEGRAELYLTGPAVSSAALAEQAAPRGAVACSPEAALLLAGKARFRQEGGARVLEAVDQPLLNRAAPPPPVTPAVAEALRAFVPEVVSARAGDISGFEAELRRVSIVFVLLRKLPDEDLWLAHRAVVAIQAELRRYEGALHHLSVDEKGPALVAAFGLPLLAHEDDPARAAMAAVGIRSALGALGISAALGVATGEVFCGTVGHESRREYTLVGPVVVRAARLMQAAVAGVLCDAATWERAKDHVKFEPPRLVEMKGQPQPVPVYAPIARRRLALRQEQAGHALVGRWREREALRRALHGLASAGQGGVMVIEADHGYGKSHLIDEAMARAREHGLSPLRGAADAVEATTPYYAWRRALATGLPSGGTIGDSMVLQAGLLQHIARDNALLDRAPLLDALVPMGLPENELTRQLSGEARAAATRDLILRLMHRMSGGKPLLIVLEDVHWMDSASLALAVAAWRRLRPILLVLTTRPGADRGPALDELERSRGFQRLVLGPLQPDEVAALLAQQLDVDRVPRQVLDLILQRAAGHPQLSLELAYALRDAGIIQVADGTCRLASTAQDLSTIALPETVQGLVRSRIDQLPARAQLLLKVASVVGRSFPLRLLVAIHPTESDRQALRVELDVLTAASMIAPVPSAAEPTWAFRDAITQQVAYNLMLLSQRQPLHRALARLHEDVHPAERAGYTALLAWHWREGGDAAAALPWTERAADQALSSGAYREAAGFYAEALRLAAEPGVEVTPLALARWRRRLGVSLVQSGRPVEGRAELDAALALLGSPLPASRAGMVLSTAIALLGHLLPSGRALRAPPEEQVSRRLEAVRALETLTELAYFEQQRLLTFHCVFRGADLARGLPDTAQRARVLANLGLAWAALPWPARAREAILRAAAAASEAGGGVQAWVAFVEGQIWMAVARWPQALDALRRATDLQRALGDQRHLAQALDAAGLVHFHRGDDTAALKTMDEVYSAGERCGDASFLAASLRGRATILTRQGLPAEALPLLDRALSLDRGASRVARVAARGEHALALWRMGKADEALALARAALAEISGVRPTAVSALAGYAGSAEVLMEAWRGAGGRDDRRLARDAHDAVRSLRTFARIYPLARPAAGLRWGQLLHARGRERLAVRAWQEALAEARRLEMPYDVVRLLAELGRHGPPEQRAAALAEAASRSSALRGFDDERTVTALDVPGSVE